RRDLHLPRGPQLRLDLINGGLDGGRGDVALLARRHQAVEHLLAVEVLAAPVLLGDVEGDVLAALVGGEAFLAAQALTTAADGLASVRVARIDDLELFVTTIWTLHKPGTAGD